MLIAGMSKLSSISTVTTALAQSEKVLDTATTAQDQSLGKNGLMVAVGQLSVLPSVFASAASALILPFQSTS